MSKQNCEVFASDVGAGAANGNGPVKSSMALSDTEEFAKALNNKK